VNGVAGRNFDAANRVGATFGWSGGLRSFRSFCGGGFFDCGGRFGGRSIRGGFFGGGGGLSAGTCRQNYGYGYQ
jgi:hypothetical protein